MNSVLLLRHTLEFTHAGTEGILAGMDNAALTPSTPGAKGGDGNHSLWILGHLAFIEGSVPQILFGEPNPVEHWAELFAPGTTPKPDAAAYPSYTQVRATFGRLRRDNIARLSSLSESDLDSVPRNVPPPFVDVMTSLANVYMLIALHNMVHYGQIADARRVAGLAPLM